MVGELGGKELEEVDSAARKQSVRNACAQLPSPFCSVQDHSP